MLALVTRRGGQVSHCLLAAGTDLSVEEAYAKIDAWKAEIGNDAAKFAEVRAPDPAGPRAHVRTDDDTPCRHAGRPAPQHCMIRPSAQYMYPG